MIGAQHACSRKLWTFYLFIFPFVFPGQSAMTNYSQQWCDHTRQSHKHIVSSLLKTEEHLTLKIQNIIRYDRRYQATCAALMTADTHCEKQFTLLVWCLGGCKVLCYNLKYNSVSAYFPYLKTEHTSLLQNRVWVNELPLQAVRDWCLGLLRGRGETTADHFKIYFFCLSWRKMIKPQSKIKWA